MSDEYASDQWIKKTFAGYFDPCPLRKDHPFEMFEGLSADWSKFSDRIFVNPPYSKPLPWVKKAILHNQRNGCHVVLLLKHDSSTKWYKLLHEADAKMLLIHRRLKYQTGKAAAFPSMLAILEGSVNDSFLTYIDLF